MFKESLLLTQCYDISVMGELLFSLHAVCFHPHNTHSQIGYRTQAQLEIHTNTHTHTPLGVSGQDQVESSVIVGGVVYDLLCVRNGDVDSIHYLSGEIAPVKYLQDKSESTKR